MLTLLLECGRMYEGLLSCQPYLALVHHGQAYINLQRDRPHGAQVHSSLTNSGREKVRRLTRALASFLGRVAVDPDRPQKVVVATSQQVQCRQTAEVMAEEFEKPITVGGVAVRTVVHYAEDERLAPPDMGVLGSLTDSQIARQFPTIAASYDQWRRQEISAPLVHPTGQPLEQYVQRVGAGIDTLRTLYPEANLIALSLSTAGLHAARSHLLNSGHPRAPLISPDTSISQAPRLIYAPYIPTPVGTAEIWRPGPPASSLTHGFVGAREIARLPDIWTHTPPTVSPASAIQYV